MVQNNGARYTFLDVYKKHGIFIPKIQRDYVQGRATAQVQKNRKSLLYKLVGVLKGEINDIMLNFVYGYQENGYFVPIDGQQRLTTLFLLHIYLYAKNKRLSELGDGKKFRYDTRETTNRFFDALFKDGNIQEFLNATSAKNVKEFIRDMEDCAWFSCSWKSDPSILSCMVMLGEMHLLLAESANEDMFQRLENITFMQLDITQDIGKANQLYIRMNARGKQLTALENFKADMYGYLEGKPVKETLVANMDGGWLDMIWGLEDTAFAEKYCDVFYRELLHWIIVDSFIAKGCDLNNLVTLTEKGKDVEQIYFDEYKAIKEEEVIEGITNICYALDVLYGLSQEDDKSYFEKIKKEFLGYIDDKGKYNTLIGTYPNRARLFAVAKFGSALAEESRGVDIERSFDLEKFKAWYRIMNNLITNAEINNIEDLQKILKGIANISNNRVLDVNQIEKDDIKDISKSYIVEEEIFKQEIINIAQNWKDLIVQAEEIPFFNGEIRFIFNALGITSKNEVNGKETDFEKACNIIAEWVGEEKYVLLRLLYFHMQTGECFYKGERFYVNNERHHNYDIRGLLREQKGYDALKRTLNGAWDIGAERYAKQCFAAPQKEVGCVGELFRQHLIHCPQIIEYCSKNGLFYKSDENKIYLIKGQRRQNMPEYISYVKSTMDKNITLHLSPNVWELAEYDYKKGKEKRKIEYQNGVYKDEIFKK